MESKIFKGYWFLPNNEENKVVGTLTYELNGDILLELDEYLQCDVSKVNSIPILLGVTFKGQKLTLISSFARQTDFTETSIKKISSNYFIVGEHFDSSDKIVFSEIEVRYNTLNKFVWRSGFLEKDLFKSEGVNIKYEKLDPIEFEIDDKVRGEINTYPDIKTNINKLHLDEYSTASIICQDDFKLSTKELMGYHLKFQHFLTLASHVPTYPTKIRLRYNETNMVELYYNVYLLDSKDKEHEFYYFHLYSIGGFFNEVMKNWYKIFEDIEPVLNLFFSEFYTLDKRMKPNNFINIINALETYHRRRRKAEVLYSDEEFKKMKEAIRENIPPEYIDFVNSKIAHGNEHTLNTRLTKLINDYKTQTFLSCVKEEDIPNFIGTLVVTRNYYTHYTAKYEDKALKGTPLFNSYKILNLLLITIILVELGIEISEVEKIHESSMGKYSDIRFKPL